MAYPLDGYKRGLSEKEFFMACWLIKTASKSQAFKPEYEWLPGGPTVFIGPHEKGVRPTYYTLINPAGRRDGLKSSRYGPKVI